MRIFSSRTLLAIFAAFIAVVFIAPIAWSQATGGDHSSHEHMMPMNGFLGDYPMSREASGTSWQPESTPHTGHGDMAGEWMTMTHGYLNVMYDRQGSPRGDDKAFTSSMLMTMGSCSLGPGTVGLRAMLSADPTMGSNGYPLLFQTGESADGKMPLVDRQHPHDLFMELAATYSLPVGEESSVFGYFGLPGEPALGPAVYMHRLSGMDNPEAPIGHHWEDATHVTEGVATLGGVWKEFKLDGSAFRGREPDWRRWDIETLKFDSYSLRLTYNPAPEWSFQASMGAIHSPEALEANVNTTRGTASVSRNVRTSAGLMQTTFVWGENNNTTGRRLDAYLLEAALHIKSAHTFFGRVERVDKDELFQAPDPLANRTFTVGKGTLGYVYDFPAAGHVQPGIGGLLSAYVKPAILNDAYGRGPVSFMVWLRAKLL